MIIERLSLRKISRISKPGKYSDGNGLYLYVKGQGKSWIFRFQRNHIERYIGLGPLHAVTLKEARKQAQKIRTLLSNGLDPTKAMEEKGDTNTPLLANNKMEKTFNECVISYIELHKKEWKSLSHLKQWQSSIKLHISPHFGNLPVHEITTELVLQALGAIWLTNTETAARLRERVERVLAWATVMGYRDGENPARWEGHLQELLPSPSKIKTVQHFASLPYQEIGALMEKLGANASTVARALQFTILTACRTSEALYASWQEIDQALRAWIIPAGRMKNSRQHRVPLTEAAAEILQLQEGLHPDWVFANAKSGKPYSVAMMRKLLKSMGYANLTVHGFRSSFRVWAAEKTDCPKEVVEMALAHKQATPVEEAYQRSDLLERRREVMQQWADFLEPTPA